MRGGLIVTQRFLDEDKPYSVKWFYDFLEFRAYALSRGMDHHFFNEIEWLNYRFNQETLLFTQDKKDEIIKKACFGAYKLACDIGWIDIEQ